jgi:hypothetical protein
MVEFYFDEHLFEQYGIELAKQCHGCSLQHTPAKTGLMQHLLENDKQFPRELVRTGGYSYAASWFDFLFGSFDSFESFSLNSM